MSEALAIWRHHAKGIEEALERCGDPATLSEVEAEVLAGRAQVWGDRDALIVTQLIPGYCHFWIATGELDAVVELSRKIRAWAKAEGYEKATLTGRRGWVRALQNEGWRERAVLMEIPTDG